MARATRSGSGVDNALLFLCLLLSGIVLVLPGELRDRAASALRRTAAAPLVDLQRRAELSRAAFVTYDERTNAQGRVAQRALAAESLESENAHLRQLLGLADRLDWGFVAAEAIPNQPATELVAQQIVTTLTVTAGGQTGITPFTPVVTADGLVGMVKTVDPGQSLIITYSDPDFRVSAMTADRSAFGIVQPHLGTGAERGLLEMRGVPFRSPLQPGQPIVSSGLGATYPAGIPVGSVLREIQTPEKWARTYLLRPAVPLSTVGPVLLLTKKRVEGGVETVWTSLAAADSAARAVAAAGDSMARVVAQQEMAARRAAFDSGTIDSLRRDSTAVPGAGVAPPIPGAAGAAPAPSGPTPVPPPSGAGAPAPRPAAPAAPAVPRPTVPAAGASASGAAAAPPRPRPAPPRTDSAAAARPRPAAAPDSGAAAPRPPAPRPAAPRATTPSAPSTPPDSSPRTAARARTVRDSAAGRVTPPRATATPAAAKGAAAKTPAPRAAPSSTTSTPRGGASATARGASGTADSARPAARDTARRAVPRPTVPPPTSARPTTRAATPRATAASRTTSRPTSRTTSRPAASDSAARARAARRAAATRDSIRRVMQRSTPAGAGRANGSAPRPSANSAAERP